MATSLNVKKSTDLKRPKLNTVSLLLTTVPTPAVSGTAVVAIKIDSINIERSCFPFIEGPKREWFYKGHNPRRGLEDGETI